MKQIEDICCIIGFLAAVACLVLSIYGVHNTLKNHESPQQRIERKLDLIINDLQIKIERK